jgi:hypothetical protein
MVAWRWLVSRLAPRNAAATPFDATAVSLLGASASMALALAVPSTTARLAIGLGAIVLALLLRGRAARSDRVTMAIIVAIAALGGAIAIDVTGGFESPDVLWLLAGGFALGVLLTAAASPTVVIDAFRPGSSSWAGAALGAALGSLVGLVSVLVGLPAIPIALAVVVGALLMVPPVASGLGGLIGRGTAVLTGSGTVESGVQVAALAALTALLVGLTGEVVGVAALILSVVVLALARWGSRALSSTAVLALALIALGAPASAQESPAPFETVAGGIRQLEVEVRADQPITDTRFDVLAGETLHLKASGAVRLVAGDEDSVVDADGEPARYGGCELGLYCGTLMASFRPDGLSRFGIGSETLVPPTAAGRLYLSVNDPDPTDNAGSFTVTIRAGPADALGVVLPNPEGVSRASVLTGDAAESAPSSLASGDAGSDGGAPAIELLVAAGLAAAGAIAGALLVRRTTTDESRPEAPA